MVFVILLLLTVWLLLVFEAPSYLYTGLIAGILLLAITMWPPALLIPAWVIFLLFAVFLHLPRLRKQILTRPLLVLFQKGKPKLSPTERAALEAGDVWWDGELFSGRPDWPQLLATPKPELTEEEQAFIDGPVEELCALLDDWDITQHRKDLSPEAWQLIKEKGFFSLIIPKEYGGLDFSAAAHSEMVTKVTSRSLTAAVTVMVPNSLGPGELIRHYGTEEQKNYYLPRLASAEEIPCFALTGPYAGSDAASIPDTGIICKDQYDGKEIIGIRLNWDKRYITLSPVATLLGLAFRLYDPDHLIGDTEDIGITCALVPTHLPGVDISKRHNPLNVPFLNGPTTGNDVFVPVEMIIGGKGGAGKGWQMLMDCLAAGRGISLPALSTGAAKLVSRDVGAYSAVRRQFGLPIGKFEGIEEVLTRIAGETWIMDAARRLTCSGLDQGRQPAVISAIVKQNLTERMRKVINDGMDIEGGKAICLGPGNHLANPYMSAPIGITVEGANILTRSMIIFGQGIVRCHPWILKELNAADNPDKAAALSEFDAAFWGHLGWTFRNGASALFYALTAGRFIRTPKSPHRRWYQIVTRYSTAFSLTADVLMVTLGGKLKVKEKITGRMADILSELYFMSAALKDAEDHPEPDQTHLMEWNCRRSLVRIKQNFLRIMRNLPFPFHVFLRVLIFPLGAGSAPPDDRLGAKVAQSILAPGPLRDRFTSGLYLSPDADAPDHVLAEAFTVCTAADPLEQKLRKAVKSGKLDGRAPDLPAEALKQGVFTAEEQELLTKARELRYRVITVDSFQPDAL